MSLSYCLAASEEIDSKKLQAFYEELKENFTCLICLGPLEDPLTTIYNKTYCKDCIIRWLEQKSSCPASTKPLTKDQLANVFLTHLVANQLKSILSSTSQKELLHRDLIDLEKSTLFKEYKYYIEKATCCSCFTCGFAIGVSIVPFSMILYMISTMFL